MGASSVTQLRRLAARYRHASHPEIKLALMRIASESRERYAASSAQSAQFFEVLCQALGELKGKGNSELRIGCYFDCVNYFYIAGDVEKGVIAARDGIALARASGNDRLAMQGYCLLGNTLADVGAVAEGIEAYVAAL